MKLNVIFILFAACALAANTYTQTAEQAKKASLTNAEAFDAFAQSIEELMTKQHGEQTFNDQLLGMHNDHILNSKSQEAELDSLMRQLQTSYKATLTVPTLSYDSKPREQVKYEQDSKHNKEAARKEAEAAKVPHNCTAEIPDGTPCAGGKCFQGKCRMTSLCYGDCCNDYEQAKLNGSPCSGGECSGGRCVPVTPCLGECCDKAKLAALPDGTKCSVGVCSKGGCVAEKTGCVAGSCCDEVHGTVRPQGFTCYTTPCQKSSNCTGFSATCPDAPKLEDGAFCPGGFCQSGVCVKPVDPTSRDPVCTEGPCCDLTTFTYRQKGEPCSNNECSSGSTCMGNSAACPPTVTPTPKKDGSACEDGTCWKGFCKPHIECDEGECCRAGRFLANYTSCSEGRCFLGKCIYDKPCLGDCCAPKAEGDEEDAPLKALENGTPCRGGICLKGRCRSPPPCFGDCCADADKTKPEVDGIPCNSGKGQCQAGTCVSPSLKCADGECCNVFKGFTFPAGFPCHADPCKKSMPCLGDNGVCIASTELKVDGFPCPGNGTCHAGVCVLPPPLEPECTMGPCCDLRRNKYLKAGTPCGTDVCKEMTFCTGTSQYCPLSLVPIEDGVICKQSLLGNWTCIAGVCEKPLPEPVLPKCNVEKACCDTFKMRVRPRGTVCAAAVNECMEPAECDGFAPECAINFRPDGSTCGGGMCVHGQCILGVDPTDDDTTHEVHVHTTRDGKFELIQVTTTRKSDGSTITKELLVEEDAIAKLQAEAEKKAAEALQKEVEEKKAAKLLVRQQQFERDVNDTMRRITEEEQKKIDNMSRAELEEHLNKTANANSTDTTQKDKKPVDPKTEMTPEELIDETSEHQRFVESLDHEGNPIRHNRVRTTGLTHAYMQCTSGLCCNMRTNMFFPYGHLCGQPANACQVAVCSGESSECYPINVKNGFRCPQGRCFDGECIAACYGECCDGKLAKLDGEQCESNGKCFNGVCVRPCVGDCCEVNNNFAKPDGAPCFGGTCESGKCKKEGGDMPAAGQKVDPLNGQKAVAVILEEKPKETNLESMWSKFTEQEHADRAAHKAKLEAQKEAEHKANLKAQQDAAAGAQKDLLQAAADKAEEAKTWMIGLIVGGAFVGLLVIVLIIVAIVVSSRKKKQAKKEAQDSEYYYEKF